MTLCEGFGPVADEQCRVLVLGSMPGVASLEKHQYYGHPRNLFWPIMGELFGAHPSLEYPERLRVLLEHHVALWDVLKLCQRPGSLDADIVVGSEQVNYFQPMLATGTAIRAVFFNGMTAEKMFRRHVLEGLDMADNIQLVRLPSTSPAHAAMSYEDKLAAWKVVAEFAANRR